MWDIIRQLQPTWAIPNRLARGLPAKASRGSSTRYMGMEALRDVQHMKDVRDAMVDIWRQSSKFRVSDEVHMVEIQVLRRLKSDGLIGWFDEPNGSGLTTLEV